MIVINVIISVINSIGVIIFVSRWFIDYESN